jgi:hypothetical protein
MVNGTLGDANGLGDADALGGALSPGKADGRDDGEGFWKERGAAMAMIGPRSTMLNATLHTTRRTKRLDARILSPAW